LSLESYFLIKEGIHSDAVCRPNEEASKESQRYPPVTQKLLCRAKPGPA
jgi:hypothetical protein